MLKEADVREALKYSPYAYRLKSHVQEWSIQQNKPEDDESVINTIVERSMSHYHYGVSRGYEWQVDTADKLLKQIHDGMNNFWKLTYEEDEDDEDLLPPTGTAGNAEASGSKLSPAIYLLLLLGPIGWIIFFCL